MMGEGPGAVGAEGDLETELAVRADERRGQDLAEGDAVRQIFREAEMEGLQDELGTTLVGGAGADDDAGTRRPCPLRFDAVLGAEALDLFGKRAPAGVANF